MPRRPRRSWAIRSGPASSPSWVPARTASARWRRPSTSARTTSATTSRSCGAPASSAPAGTWSMPAGSTTSATRRPARRRSRRSSASCDDRPSRVRRTHLPFWPAVGPGGRRLAGRLVHHPAAGELGRLRPARPAGGLAARRCASPSSCTTCPRSCCC